MKTALAIFAKTPGLSPVKTRLAADFGQENAEEFYRMSLDAVEEMAIRARELSKNTIDLFWAVPERSIADQPILGSFPVLWTGEEGLGKGLYSVLAKLFESYKQVIIIGTDSPQLRENLILEAVDRLFSKSTHCVIGPCPDGGFYLFGSNKIIPPSLWCNVEYSSSKTRHQLTEMLLASGFSFSLLPQAVDIDHLDDLKLLYDRLAAEDSILPSQKRLLSWLEHRKRLFL